jgi:hypothetical protein
VGTGAGSHVSEINQLRKPLLEVIVMTEALNVLAALATIVSAFLTIKDRLKK